MNIIIGIHISSEITIGQPFNLHTWKKRKDNTLNIQPDYLPPCNDNQENKTFSHLKIR